MIECLKLPNVRQYVQVNNLGYEKTFIEASASEGERFNGTLFKRKLERLNGFNENEITSVALVNDDVSKIVFYNDSKNEIVKEYKIKGANILKLFVNSVFAANKQIIIFYVEDKDKITLKGMVIRLLIVKGKIIIRKKEIKFSTNELWFKGLEGLKEEDKQGESQSVSLPYLLMYSKHFNPENKTKKEMMVDFADNMAFDVSSYTQWREEQSDAVTDNNTLTNNTRDMRSCQVVARSVDSKNSYAIILKDFRLGVSSRGGLNLITDSCWSEFNSVVGIDHEVDKAIVKVKSSKLVIGIEGTAQVDSTDCYQGYFFFPFGAETPTENGWRLKAMRTHGLRMSFTGMTDFSFTSDMKLFVVITNTNQIYLYNDFDRTLADANATRELNSVPNSQNIFSDDFCYKIIPEKDTDPDRGYLVTYKERGRNQIKELGEENFSGVISNYKSVPMRQPDRVMDIVETNKKVTSVYVHKSLHTFAFNRSKWLILVTIEDETSKVTTIRGLDHRLNVLFDTDIAGKVANINYKDYTDHPGNSTYSGVSAARAADLKSFLIIRTVSGDVIKIGVKLGNEQNTNAVARDMTLERIANRVSTQDQVGRYLDI